MGACERPASDGDSVLAFARRPAGRHAAHAVGATQKPVETITVPSQPIQCDVAGVEQTRGRALNRLVDLSFR